MKKAQRQKLKIPPSTAVSCQCNVHTGNRTRVVYKHICLWGSENTSSFFRDKNGHHSHIQHWDFLKNSAHIQYNIKRAFLWLPQNRTWQEASSPPHLNAFPPGFKNKGKLEQPEIKINNGKKWATVGCQDRKPAVFTETRYFKSEKSKTLKIERGRLI